MAPPPPVVFIHGLWLHSTSWQPWAEMFQAAGHATYTPEWPGVADTVAETRAHPEAQAGKGLREIIAAHAEFLQSLDAKPILIGHSFGGLIVQSLMGESLGAAGVAIDPAQIRGVLPLPFAQLRSGFPALGDPRNYKRAVALTEPQFRYAFANAVSKDEAQQLYDAWTIPSTARPLFEAAAANFNPHTAAKAHTVPDVVTRSAYKRYKHSTAITDLRQLPRGHSLTIDSGWREVAQTAMDWLQAQGLGGRPGGAEQRIDLDAAAQQPVDGGSAG
jgi:pimeloyl-ACP methyl ester carboxylesterase